MTECVGFLIVWCGLVCSHPASVWLFGELCEACGVFWVVECDLMVLLVDFRNQTHGDNKCTGGFCKHRRGKMVG